MPANPNAAVQSHIAVPAHIAAIASAVRYDLLYGPCYLRLPKGDPTLVDDDCMLSWTDDLEPEPDSGDVIEQTYVGKAAGLLRTFLDDLPSSLWYDTDADDLSTAEPEGEEVDGEWYEPHEYWQRLDHGDIVEALFGQTIAREFR